MKCIQCGKMSSNKHYTCIHDWLGTNGYEKEGVN